MAADVLMPKLGLTMEEGTIERWLKKAGDEVAAGEPILEIMTDKVSAEIEAPASGRLGPILFSEGATVPVGEIIAYVLAEGEEAPEVGAAATSGKQTDAGHEETVPTRASAQGSTAPAAGKRIAASPIARRVAKELGVDLAAVKGSGPAGRVVEEDVRRAAADRRPSLRDAGELGGVVRPLEGRRKISAERMVHSFTTAPHFYLSVEADAGLLVKLRESLMASVEEQSGERLTISDLLIKLAGRALEDHPEVNAVWDGNGVRSLASISVGLAVASDHGLIVPVVHDVANKPLAEVAAKRAELTEKARSGRLDLKDVEGGSFTISNLGVYSVDQFNAILNPPQAAILAVGRIKDRPAAVDGQLTVRPTVFLTLSADHRILDGAEAARFLTRLVSLIEEPYLLLSV
jgi:pyruvate dehydrogenase E2 component (dihydrolipoamide acetyltransferase)